jgi:hypothetical protein
MSNKWNSFEKEDKINAIVRASIYNEVGSDTRMLVLDEAWDSIIEDSVTMLISDGEFRDA